MGILSDRARDYVSGPAWDSIREQFGSICETFLGVSPDTKGDLTTIYVKFSILTASGEQVYGVAWLRSSKQIVLGMALSDETCSPVLGPAPKGCSYRGLTKYLIVRPGESLPPELHLWAKQAYDQAVNRK